MFIILYNNIFKQYNIVELLKEYIYLVKSYRVAFVAGKNIKSIQLCHNPCNDS